MMTATSPLQPADFFHTGIVVPDLTRAKDELAAAFGATWGFAGEVEMPFVLEDGFRVLPMRFAYSAEGPPYLELIQAVPGTMFELEGGGGAHHVGYWCPDPGAVAAALETQGMTRVATVGVSSLDEEAHWIMLRSSGRLLIELVDEGLRASFEAGEMPDLG